MKVIERNSSVVETIGDLQSENFKIKASAKSFEILSKGIYSDPIRPPIRELATNAWDSHVAAGNLDTPFEVHVPSITEPYFYVQDFGVGMTQQEVRDIYTTYFESTKVESNDYIGCLGLGSKSPFCYTDTFNVESICDGIKSFYICYTENGMPRVTCVDSENSTEHSGMKISFSVKLNDIESFKKQIADIYSYFKNRPKILNGGDLKIIDREYEIETNDYKFSRKGGGRYDVGNVNIVMGNIVYVVHRNQIPTDRSIDWLFDCGVEFQMPIGSVDVSANRESIHFDDRSKRNIQNKLNFIASDVRKQMQKTINDLPNYWSAAEYIESFGAFRFSWGFKNKVLDSMTYKGRDIKCVHQFVFGLPKRCRVRVFRYRGTVRGEYETSFSIKKDVFFVINDLKKGPTGRCRNYVLNNPQSVLYIIKDVNHPKTNSVSCEFLETLEVPKDRILYTSKMDVPTVEKRKSVLKTDKNRRQIHYFCNPKIYWGVREYDYLRPIVIDDITKRKHLYVITHSGSVTNKFVSSFSESKNITTSDVIPNRFFLKDCLPMFVELDLEFGETEFETNPQQGQVMVKCINYQKTNSFINKPNWINLFKLLGEYSDLYVKKYKDQYINLKLLQTSISNINVFDVNCLLDLFPKHEELLKLKSDIDKFESNKENKKFIDKFENILKFTNEKTSFDVICSKPVNPNNVIGFIYKKYPLLRPNPTHKELLDYINLVDKQ